MYRLAIQEIRIAFDPRLSICRASQSYPTRALDPSGNRGFGHESACSDAPTRQSRPWHLRGNDSGPFPRSITRAEFVRARLRKYQARNNLPAMQKGPPMKDGPEVPATASHVPFLPRRLQPYGHGSTHSEISRVRMPGWFPNMLAWMKYVSPSTTSTSNSPSFTSAQ